MATINDTVKLALLSYPTLFSSASDVLHHLFCVNGNGYYWENGELIGGEDTSTIDSNALAEKGRDNFSQRIAKFKSDPLFKGSDNTLFDEQQLHNYNFIVANIDRFSSTEAIRRPKLNGGLYPLSSICFTSISFAIFVILSLASSLSFSLFISLQT